MDIKKSKSKDDRKDRTGIVGSPKKGGGGGKGTWGKGGADDLIQSKVDTRDPNYDSDEEEIVDSKSAKNKDTIMKPVEVNSPIETILREYFVEGEIGEVVRRLKEVTVNHVDFIRKSIVLSMEKQPYERELVSKLLSQLYGQYVSPADISDGFKSTISKLDDIVLDIPEASDMLGKFIARAIIDEIIPPSFLKSVEAETEIIKECTRLANGYINDPHRSKKLEHIWGPGDLESVKRLQKEVAKLVEEYFTSNDKVETERCIRNLNVPHFHFHIVKQALVQSCQHDDQKNTKKILDLLLFFNSTGIVSPAHVAQGFKAYQAQLEDIKLDAPKAPTVFNQIVKSAIEAKLLDESFNK